MENLQTLIGEAKPLLNEVIKKCNSDVLNGELVSKIKSLHTKGRFYLKKIDKPIFKEYSELFSRTFTSESWDRWNNYIRTEFEKCLGILMAIDSFSPDFVIDKTINKVFISHGRFSPCFYKIESFIKALGLFPIYDINEPSQGKNINTHVQKLFDNSDFYIVLATKETKRDEQNLPNHNVVIEFDRLIQTKQSNVIVLLEEDCKMPSMLQDVIYISFDPNKLEDVFIKIAIELNKSGLLN
jgi:hypothetical protein